MKFSELLTKWPDLKISETGGGHGAYRLEDESHSRYFLVTGSVDDVSGDDPMYPPSTDATCVTLGAYCLDDEDDYAVADFTCEQVDVVFNDIIAGRDAVWLDRGQWIPGGLQLPSRTLATSIADLFALTFNRRPASEGLARLPVRSPCGADCRSAIDAGFALLRHVRAACGGDAKSEEDLSKIVEAVINIYDAG